MLNLVHFIVSTLSYREKWNETIYAHNFIKVYNVY